MKNVTNQKIKTLWRKNSHPLIPKNIKPILNKKPHGDKQTKTTKTYRFELNIKMWHLIVGIFLIYILYKLL